MQIDLNYSITPDDHYELQRSSSKITKSRISVGPLNFSHRIIWIVVIVLSMAIFIVIPHDRTPTPMSPISAPPSPPETPSSILFGILPYLVLFITIWWLFFYQNSKKRVQRRFNEDPTLAEPRTASFADDGMVMTDATATTHMRWQHFARFAETKNLFVLMIGRDSAHILPKRAFPSPAALAEFRAFAQAHIGNTPIGFPVLPAQSPPTTETCKDVETPPDLPK